MRTLAKPDQSREKARFDSIVRRGVLKALALSVALIFAVGTATAADAPSWKWQHKEGQSLTLMRGDAVLWQFHYAPELPKPYFHPVALPDGRVVTWNSPPDHRWHHGLWFSWKFLNGLNYWEPDATGRPAGRTEWANVKATTRPNHTARIAMDLTYRPAGAQAPLLKEKRTVDVSAPGESGGYHFDWTCAFTAGAKDVKLDRTPLPGEPGGKAFGGYAGLSVRFAKELTDRQAVTTDGPVEFNPQSRYRGKALAFDYDGSIDGRPIGVAICDHPDNLNHPSPWYAIRSKPMSYFSPAVICYAPHTLEAGKSFTLRYRVLVHPDRWDAERLNAEQRRFVRESSNRKGR